MKRSPLRRVSAKKAADLAAGKPAIKRAPLRRVSDAKSAWQVKYRKAKRDRMEQMTKRHGAVHCERCGGAEHAGQSGPMDPHHPDGQNGALILHFFYVCRPCHDWIHFEHPNAARAEGWLRAKNAAPGTRTQPKLAE